MFFQTGKQVIKRLFSLSSLSIATCCLLPTPFRTSTIPFCRTMSYTIEQYGTPYTEDYKLFFKNAKGGIISPMHDIPIMADPKNGTYNMVVEIPKWTNAKMEISTKDIMNPIKQDVKKGKVRFVKNIFPYKGYVWNYGAIPQTWENPTVTDRHTGQKGDGDPIDVVEIGYKVAARGEVKQVKVLGVMALIDEGETDWKVIAIDIGDPLAPELNDIDDVRSTMPGLIEAIHEWLKIYKIPAGSPANEFAFNGEAKNRSFTVEIINELHKQWEDLILKKIDIPKGFACETVSVSASPCVIDQAKANDVTSKLPALSAPAALPDDVDMMYYLTEQQKNS